MPGTVSLRLAVALLALCGGLVAFHGASRDDRAMETVANKILDGEHFSASVLTDSLRRGELAPGECHPRRLRMALVLHAQLADLGLQDNDIAARDAALLALEAYARRVITCAPGESYAWLTLAWSLSRQAGWSQPALAALRQSYATGAREAWVGVRRLQLVILTFSQLPADLQQAAVQEFRGMLDLSMWDFIADILAIARGELRARLMQEAAQTSESNRIKLALALRARDLPTRDLGLPEQSGRPWRRD